MPLRYDSTLRVLYEELESLSLRDRVPCATRRQFMEESRNHQAKWSTAKPDADPAWILYWAEASLWNNLVSSRYDILKPFPGRPPIEVPDNFVSATEAQPTFGHTPNTPVKRCSRPATPTADAPTDSAQSADLKERREQLERELKFEADHRYQEIVTSSESTFTTTPVEPSRSRDKAAGNKVESGDQAVRGRSGASQTNIMSLSTDEPVLEAHTSNVFKKTDLKPNSQKARKIRSHQLSDVPDVSQLGISSATQNAYATSKSTNAAEEKLKSSSKEEAFKLRCSLKTIFSKPENSNVEINYEPSFWNEELGLPRSAVICSAPNAITALWGNDGDAVEKVNEMIGSVVRILVVLHPLGTENPFFPLIWQDVHFGYNPYDPDVQVVVDWVQQFIDEFSSLEEECESLPDEFHFWAKRNFPPPEVKKWLPKRFVDSIARVPRGRGAFDSSGSTRSGSGSISGTSGVGSSQGHWGR